MRVLRSVLALWACSAIAGPAFSGVVRHALWDAAQKPMVQQCARDFERANPGVQIRIQQQGWDDYWTTLSTGFVAETAPDVFTNHLTKFAAQALNGVLVDLAPLIARDHVPTDLYEKGLLANWSRGAAQYGLPADWDTIALVVNLDMARAAGISLAELQSMNWNPRDGGSFGRIAERLTRDRQGRSLRDAGFDARAVQVRGFQVPGSGGMFGQTEWSHFAVSNGFRYQDAAWQGPLRYDDPALTDTLDWLASLSRRGISGPPKTKSDLGSEALFVTGRAAMISTGSWMLGYFTRSARFAHAFVPLPVGPRGTRATMLNGLAHSIWRGSKNPGEAWLWVRYLGSPACQQVVASHGVVYPAVRGLAEAAAQAQRKSGAEPQAFLDMARERTFGPPIVDQSEQINDLIDAAIEQVLLGRSRAADALGPANRKANALLAR